MNTRVLFVYLCIHLSISTSAQSFADYTDYGDLNLTKASQGVAAADYDNDGDLDIYITAFDPFIASDSATWSRLYQNNGDGKFIDVTLAAGLGNQYTNPVKSDNFVGSTSGASWGDYNNDGLVDLFLAIDGPDFLYKNNGDGTFTDVTTTANVAGCIACYSASALWWDFDNDSDLDLYISDYNTHNRFYENNGDGTFTEKAQELGIDDNEESWSAMPFDYDEDGDWDFYLANDNGPNRLFLKEGGVFINVADTLNIDDPGNGMGLGIVDYNFDGIYDLYVTNIHNNRPNPFYMGFSKEVTTEGGLPIGYEEKAQALGIQNTFWGWDLAFFDADHDLDNDLAVATYGTNNFNYLFANRLDQGRDIFSDVSIQSGVYKEGGAFGLEAFDFDTDGDLDLLFSNRDKSPYLLRNNTNKNSTDGKNWVQLYFVGEQSNKSGFGVEVYLTVDGVEYRKLYNGVGVGRQSFKPMHFGLDNLETIESIRLVWPSGTTDVYNDLDVNLLYTMTEGSGFETRVLEPMITASDIEFDLDHTIARIWNEELLNAIRNDFARPTVHARNLFHTSAAMFDAYATFSRTIDTYLLGKERNGFFCAYDEGMTWEREEENIRAAISYAAYRMIANRFANSPGAVEVLARIEALMEELGYDTGFTSVDYSSNDPRALGNYIAQCVIDYGYQDGSNQANDYANLFYEPKNSPLVMDSEGNPNMTAPNNWQPLTLDVFIDQSGNVVSDNTPDFLSPEWGEVYPFSLDEGDMETKTRDGDTYQVYVDPGAPPMMDSALEEEYKWGFTLVSIWSSHLGNDGVMWDISPGAKGNYDIENYPTDYPGFRSFYNTFDGGDPGTGHTENPHTGLAYEPNIVPRTDYARVLAEFWADGPDSETPPGHWFTILNYVSDNPLLEKRLGGEGRLLSDLEWDIITYFTLGGGMHDAAVSAWSVKGYYDYIRPVSAIRYMADLGQSTNPADLSYHENGIPLSDGYVELVRSGDPLAGSGDENVGKIKLYTWRGPDYIQDPDTDEAGVGWILAENWWPYQRPSFVTPPFAGFVSGHSTFSRAAAEIMTQLTGDEFFPGGMGEFVAKQNEFLVFEEGPSVDVHLQWATYRDASDQTSLSRIWGGIHPPADDLPGRLMGEYIGNKAYDYALSYFENVITSTIVEPEVEELTITAFPNPMSNGDELKLRFIGRVPSSSAVIKLTDINGRTMTETVLNAVSGGSERVVPTPGLSQGIYVLEIGLGEERIYKRIIVQ
jgi:hypothetical protein